MGIDVITLALARSGNHNNLPIASSSRFGAIKADPKLAQDIQPVRIGNDGKLYTQNKNTDIAKLNIKISWQTAPVTVTLKKDTQVYSVTTNTNGEATLQLKDFGLYTINYSTANLIQPLTEILVSEGLNYNLDLEYKVVYGVKINENNSNPLTSVEYTDDAVGMYKGNSTWNDSAIFSKIKPCVFNSGTVQYYLNRNDYTKKVDGSNSILTGEDGDVMVEFPKFGYKFERIGSDLYVKITNDPESEDFNYKHCSKNSEGDKDKFYIGAYKGFVALNKLNSISNVSPTVSNTIANFRTYAKNKGDSYGILNFYMYSALQCLYLIKYGNLNCYNALGYGLIAGNFSTTGGANLKSFCYGSNSVKNQQLKLFGIEDPWGNILEYLDGIINDESYTIKTNFIYSNFDAYDTYINTGIGKYIRGNLKKVKGTPELGFLPDDSDASSTTYYCNEARMFDNARYYVGGTYNQQYNYGIFSLNSDIKPDFISQTMSARLVYC